LAARRKLGSASGIARRDFSLGSALANRPGLRDSGGGQNEAAARAAGIDAGKVRIIALSIAGGLAGLVGVGEVLGNAAKIQDGIFTGVRLHRHRRGAARPQTILQACAAAFLFGALHKGNRRSGPGNRTWTREVSLVLQAPHHSVRSADGLWSWLHTGRKSLCVEELETFHDRHERTTMIWGLLALTLILLLRVLSWAHVSWVAMPSNLWNQLCAFQHR